MEFSLVSLKGTKTQFPEDTMICLRSIAQIIRQVTALVKYLNCTFQAFFSEMEHLPRSRNSRKCQPSDKLVAVILNWHFSWKMNPSSSRCLGNLNLQTNFPLSIKLHKRLAPRLSSNFQLVCKKLGISQAPREKPLASFRRSNTRVDGVVFYWLVTCNYLNKIHIEDFFVQQPVFD